VPQSKPRKRIAQTDARELRLAKLAEYRQKRLTLAQYARDLGINYRTALRDVEEFKDRQVAMSEDFVNADSMIQEEEIGALKLELIDLKAMARDNRLTLKDQLAAALACIDRQVKIMEREASLHGWDAPKKTASVNTNLTIDATSRFHQFIEAAAGLDEGQFAEALLMLRGIPRKQLEQPPGPPLLLEGN
jgi:hypothetical protein